MLKWIGLLIGLFKGPLGAVLGFTIGWWLDSKISKALRGQGFRIFAGGQQAQTIFQRALFGALGHLAKADGRVSEHEIHVAEQVMTQLRLNKRQREEAVSNFRLGKSNHYPLIDELKPFMQLTQHQPHLRRLFVEILLNGALADGTIKAAERQILEQVVQILGMTVDTLNKMIQQRYAHHQASHDLDKPDPYLALGIQSSATESEIKRAYRKLMSEYHPDKMAGRDVPSQMREYANDKVREVRAAYDTIRKERSFR